MALAVLIACFGSAVAQQNGNSGADNSFANVLGGAKLKADPGNMPDFVVNSRSSTDSLHYIPVGGPRPEPQTPALTVDQIKAEEAELDQLKRRHDRLARRKTDPGPHVSVADGRKKRPPKPHAPKCILTCDILKLPKPGAN